MCDGVGASVVLLVLLKVGRVGLSPVSVVPTCTVSIKDFPRVLMLGL